jgi:hypothetical protein
MVVKRQGARMGAWPRAQASPVRAKQMREGAAGYGIPADERHKELLHQHSSWLLRIMPVRAN